MRKSKLKDNQVFEAVNTELISLTRVLNSKQNRKLITLIKENPGITVVELQIRSRLDSQSDVSQRLKKLSQLNIVELVRNGKYKMVYYNYKSEVAISQLNATAKTLVNKSKR